MEKQIVDGQIGPEADYDVDFIDGKIVAKLNYAGKFGSAGLSVEIGLMDALRMAAAKSENKIDDTIVNLVEAALK